MSEPAKRYYKTFSDNMALQSENARLKAEVERLSKAGDAMLALWEKTQGGHWAIDDAKPAWNAAKEGKPSA